MKKDFFRGMYNGIPIALGYLSVSFGFGIIAVKSGLSAFTAVIISGTNLTSAGQAAAIGIISSGGAVIEMILTQFTINLRYSLMSLSLSQKLDESFTFPKKLIASFGITDEIFAVAVSRTKKLTPSYMYGLILTPFIAWTLGTFLGAWAGEMLPAVVVGAMGILLYGMFVAIIIPPSRKDRKVFFVIIIAMVISCIFRYLIPQVSGGFVIIISAALSALTGAVFFPIKEENECQ